MNFAKDGVYMLNGVKVLFKRSLISIDRKFTELIFALQTYKEENGHVLKEQIQHDDIFDNFWLSLRNYQDYDLCTKRQLI